MSDACNALADIMQRGGPVMWPIAACSVFLVFVVLRKAIQWLFYRLSIKWGAEGWDEIVRLVQANKLEEAAGAVRTCSSPFALVYGRALKLPDVTLEEAVQLAGKAEVRRLARGLGVLDTIVTLAPMLGILGTVTGIITSFSVLGTAGVEDPTGVAGGIAEALITTAAGLIVSIAALIPLNGGRVIHKAFVRKLEFELSRLERQS